MRSVLVAKNLFAKCCERDSRVFSFAVLSFTFTTIVKRNCFTSRKCSMHQVSIDRLQSMNSYYSIIVLIIKRNIIISYSSNNHLLDCKNRKRTVTFVACLSFFSIVHDFADGNVDESNFLSIISRHDIVFKVRRLDLSTKLLSIVFAASHKRQRDRLRLSLHSRPRLEGTRQLSDLTLLHLRISFSVTAVGYRR